MSSVHLIEDNLILQSRNENRKYFPPPIPVPQSYSKLCSSRPLAVSFLSFLSQYPVYHTDFLWTSTSFIFTQHLTTHTVTFPGNLLASHSGQVIGNLHVLYTLLIAIPQPYTQLYRRHSTVVLPPLLTPNLQGSMQFIVLSPYLDTFNPFFLAHLHFLLSVSNTQKHITLQTISGNIPGAFSTRQPKVTGLS